MYTVHTVHTVRIADTVHIVHTVYTAHTVHTVRTVHTVYTAHTVRIADMRAHAYMVRMCLGRACTDRQKIVPFIWSSTTSSNSPMETVYPFTASLMFIT